MRTSTRSSGSSFRRVRRRPTARRPTCCSVCCPIRISSRRSAADRLLLPQAIEEGHPVGATAAHHHAHGNRKTSRCAVCPIPAGAMVICNLGSANHDDSRWEQRRAVRHLPYQPAPHRLRLRAAYLPRHASGADGDARRHGGDPRPFARSPLRPGCTCAVHLRPDLPRAALVAAVLGLAVAELSGALPRRPPPLASRTSVPIRPGRRGR